MLIAKRSSHHWSRFLVNIIVPILVVAVTYYALEIWARCKYYKGHIKQKMFFSRGKEFTAKKQTPVRIVCVGSSSTHGGGYLQDNETYPYYLEELINNKLGPKEAQVINSGIPGKTTEYQRDLIRNKIGDQELDIIIWDPVNTHFFPFWPAGPNVKNIIVEQGTVKNVYMWDKMSLIDIIHVFLSEHSYLYVRLREKLLRMAGSDLNRYYARKKDYIKDVEQNKYYNADSEQDKNKVLTIFLSRFYTAVEDVIMTAKAHNIELIILIPPYPFFAEEAAEDIKTLRSKQYYNVACEKAKELLIKFAKRYNLQVIDADEGFIKIGRSVDMGIDGVHLSKKGNYALAGVISSELLPYLEKIKIKTENK